MICYAVKKSAPFRKEIVWRTMKLINAETLITVLEEHQKRTVGYEHATIACVIKMIKLMPTIDTEERNKLP